MRVGIIGGGITGLALTHALARLGVESVLFEKEERAGGIVASREIDGRVFEMGPQRTRLVPPVRRLVEELALLDRVIEARPDARLFMWTRGRLREVPGPRSLLASDLLSRRGRLRLLAEPLTAGLRADESVSQFFTRKTGGEAYRTLFGPLVSATFASDPERMPARHSLRLLLEPLGVRKSLLAAARRWGPGTAPACTFKRGMEELTAALASRHAGRIRLGTPVRGVASEPSGVAVYLEEGETERVDHVVITTPAHVTGRLLRGTTREDAAAAAALEGLTYNEVCVVSLRAEPGHVGFGFQTAFDAPWRTRGVTWTGSLFGRDGVCTAFLGGGLDPEISGWTDDDVADCAVREFSEIHERPAEAVAVSRASLPAYDESWDALDGLALPSRVTVAANYVDRLGIPARIAQAEELAAAFAGTMG